MQSGNVFIITNIALWNRYTHLSSEDTQLKLKRWGNGKLNTQCIFRIPNSLWKWWVILYYFFWMSVHDPTDTVIFIPESLSGDIDSFTNINTFHTCKPVRKDMFGQWIISVVYIHIKINVCCFWRKNVS